MRKSWVFLHKSDALALHYPSLFTIPSKRRALFSLENANTTCEWKKCILRIQVTELEPGENDSLSAGFICLWPLPPGGIHPTDTILTSGRPSLSLTHLGFKAVPPGCSNTDRLQGLQEAVVGVTERWCEVGRGRGGKERGTWGTPGGRLGRTVIGHCQPHSTLPLIPWAQGLLNITDLPEPNRVESKVVLKQVKDQPWLLTNKSSAPCYSLSSFTLT